MANFTVRSVALFVALVLIVFMPAGAAEDSRVNTVSESSFLQTFVGQGAREEMVASITIPYHFSEEKTLYECIDEDAPLGFFDFVASFFTGRVSDVSERECVMIPMYEVVKEWNEGEGSRRVVTEKLTRRYGGDACTTTIRWPPEMWPPRKIPYFVDNDCDEENLSGEFLSAIGNFGEFRYENAEVVNRQMLPTGIKREVHYRAKTTMHLNVKGEPDKKYRVKLDVTALEIKGYGTAVLSMHPLTRWDYTVARKRIGSSQKIHTETIFPPGNFIGGKMDFIKGTVELDAFGGSVIDVTPKSRAKHYLFDVRVVSVEEK